MQTKKSLAFARDFKIKWIIFRNNISIKKNYLATTLSAVILVVPRFGANPDSTEEPKISV